MHKRIMVPLDGSDTSRQALDVAIAMARINGGELNLVHLMSESGSRPPLEQGTTSASAEAARERACNLLDDSLALAAAQGVTATRLLVERHAPLGEAIASEATRWNADLIVVGTHGRRGIQRFLMGSGAEQVLRAAPTHVLVVRPKAGG